MCKWVGKERAAQVLETIKTQRDTVRLCKLDSLEKLGGYLEEADFFVEELSKSLLLEDYEGSMKHLWVQLVGRMGEFERIYGNCIPQETKKRYRFFSKMESLAQLMQMLLR